VEYNQVNTNNNNNNSDSAISKNEVDIKNALMKLRTYFSQPVAEARMEAFAAILNKEGFSGSVVAAGLKDLLLEKNQFPSLAEIFKEARKRQTPITEATEYEGCAKCSYCGVIHQILYMPDDPFPTGYSYAFSCNCSKGRNEYSGLPSFQDMLALKDKYDKPLQQ
jgi:hypothetical protein